MKALIVDDSRLARVELRHLLDQLPFVEVVGEAQDGPGAIQLVEQLRPDVLFLDIQMPGMDGFSVLEALDTVPSVIFTTAYNEYALKAFEVNALDYLQKPIELERLKQAVQRVVPALSANPASPAPNTCPLGPEQQVFVKDGDQCWFVRLGEIQIFEVEGSYTRIAFQQHRPLISKSLNQLEERLDPATFFRINRQQIVNLNAIQKVEPWFSGGLRLTLSGGLTAEVSRRQTSQLKERMSL